MIKTFLLGLIVAKILTLTITFNVIADPAVDIKQIKIKTDESRIQELQIMLKDKIQTQPFGGYAIFTEEGSVIAVTSHAGFFDSYKQISPSDSQIALQVGKHAFVCNVTDVACGPEWHTHLVEPVDSEHCDFKAVGELTHTEPSNWLEFKNKKITVKSIDMGNEAFKEAMGGNFRDFKVGTPIEEGMVFNLVPEFVDPSDIRTLLAICIVPTGESRF